MKYRYRVYHDEAGKDRVERAMWPLSDDAREREYSLLPAHFSHKFGPDIAFTTEQIEKGEGGVLVEFDSTKPRDDVDKLLGDALVALNMSVRGLCLVVDRQ